MSSVWPIFRRRSGLQFSSILLYFVQFLRDLGIDAQGAILESAGQSLFRVRPTSGRDALERVRAALAVYLRCATMSPSAIRAAGGLDLAVEQFAGQVQALQVSVGLLTQHNELGTAQALAALGTPGFSEKAASVERHDEPLLGRFITVGKWTKFGVTIDWAEMLRSLKRVR